MQQQRQERRRKVHASEHVNYAGFKVLAIKLIANVVWGMKYIKPHGRVQGYTQCILVSNTECEHNFFFFFYKETPCGPFKCLFTHLWRHFQIISVLITWTVGSLIDSFFTHVHNFSWNLQSQRKNSWIIVVAAASPSSQLFPTLKHSFLKKSLHLSAHNLSHNIVKFACWSCFFFPEQQFDLKVFRTRGERHATSDLAFSLPGAVCSLPQAAG